MISLSSWKLAQVSFSLCCVCFCKKKKIIKNSTRVEMRIREKNYFQWNEYASAAAAAVITDVENVCMSVLEWCSIITLV